MKTLLKAGAMSLLAFGCVPFGAIYHDVKAPPEGMSLTPVNGARTMIKTGRACAHGVLGLVAWGDASQQAAANNGGITKVYAADETRMGVLAFVYREYCTVVSGE
ncbi:MAG TPA: TRL-like family protein [Polyangiaceae bacterium]|jgi:hypothetical protein|nr:TRL-like family protein [Polyangiaceae bacterium]